MDKGATVLVLRKFDLGEEAEAGEDICETIFELYEQDERISEEDKQDLCRYFISIDNLHKDICGENLSTCKTVQMKTKKEV